MDWEALIADVAGAVNGAHTRLGLARRVGVALREVFDLRRVVLGWGDERAVAEWRRKRWSLSESRQPLRESVKEVVAQGVAIARGEQLVLPLQGGYALVVLKGAPPKLEASTLRALANVIGIPHGSVRAISRVAAASRKAHEESRDLRKRLDGLTANAELVAVSDAMRNVLAQAEAVAMHPTPVLLRGPSGTGKGLLARWIHDRSVRAKGPFVVVNCGALPEALLESELFGHAQGAFTGAVRARRGRFERANGGTIFLDEIAELPAMAQVKLLHVLQDGVFEPLGSEEQRAVDVRVLAATHRPLESMIEEGTFREDLYYRLNVFPLKLPALCDRPEDIPPLAKALLERIARRLDRDVPRLSPGALARLAQLPWPGNVRELSNVLERAAILSTGSKLELPDGVAQASLSRRVTPEAVHTFAEGTRRCIESALCASRGKLYGAGGAAELLDLNPSTLQTKMRKLGIRRSAFTARLG